MSTVYVIVLCSQSDGPSLAILPSFIFFASSFPLNEGELKLVFIKFAGEIVRRTEEEHIALIQSIMEKAMRKDALLCELYMQLIKQTTEHPDPNSRVNLRHWAVLSLACSVALPPHRNIRKYLMAHLRKCASDYLTEEGKYARFAEKVIIVTVAKVLGELELIGFSVRFRDFSVLAGCRERVNVNGLRPRRRLCVPSIDVSYMRVFISWMASITLLNFTRQLRRRMLCRSSRVRSVCGNPH